LLRDYALTTTKQMGYMRLRSDARRRFPDSTCFGSDQVHAKHAKQCNSFDTASTIRVFAIYLRHRTRQPKGVVMTHMAICCKKSDSVGVETSENGVVTWLRLSRPWVLIGNMMHSIWAGATWFHLPPLSFFATGRCRGIGDFTLALLSAPNFCSTLRVNKYTSNCVVDLLLGVALMALSSRYAMHLERFV